MKTAATSAMVYSWLAREKASEETKVLLKEIRQEKEIMENGILGSETGKKLKWAAYQKFEEMTRDLAESIQSTRAKAQGKSEEELLEELSRDLIQKQEDHEGRRKSEREERLRRKKLNRL